MHSDAEIQQEYQNYAVVLYQSAEDNGRTTRKGYIPINALEIADSNAETNMYWIGKTWSEAFCSQDSDMLYQMAADKKSVAEWDFSHSYPQCSYQVNLLTEKDSEKMAADIALQFFVQTPEPNVWTQRQNLKIASTPRQLENIGRIDDLLNNTVYFSEIKNYEQVTSYSEYQDAFLAACEFGPRYFDFKGSGYAAIYSSGDPVEQILSLHSPDELETLLEKYLNLSGGNGGANIMTLRIRDNDRATELIQLAYVEYAFIKADESGQNQISIPMYYDKDGYWYIWVSGQDEAIDKALQGALESFPIKSFE